MISFNSFLLSTPPNLQGNKTPHPPPKAPTLPQSYPQVPLPTQDLELNTRNRDSAIKADYIKYGPLNVDEPGDFWDELAEHWLLLSSLFLH